MFRCPPRFSASLLTGAALALLVACSASDGSAEFHDPYERTNRFTHAVNKGTDRVFFRPASHVYGTVVPQRVRGSLSNVASNLDMPRSIVNDILQGEVEDAGHNFARLLVNTTLGVFGLFDPAGNDFGLEDRRTGFGDTLAVWGVREGAYLELPLFGPSTERDAVGKFVDILANPLTAIDNGPETAAATSLPSVLDARYEYSDTIDSILYESADSYAQMRLYYLENRRFVLGGQGSADNAFDPYEDLYEEVYEGLYDDFRN